MAVHFSNSVNWFLSLPLQLKEYLGTIRHWENLKIGFEEETIWIRDLTAVQVDSLEIKTIPYKTIYYSSGPHLFLHGSLLPDRIIPSLLWTPIERGLPVKTAGYNHNYFGLHDKIDIELVKSTEEKDAYGCLVSLHSLQSYIEKATAVRLKNLSWIMIDDMALILGSPLLPLTGEVYWRRKDFLFPAGYMLELELLNDTLEEIINPLKDNWVIWTKEGSYWKLTKDAMKPLSIGSLRQSLKPQYGNA